MLCKFICGSCLPDVERRQVSTIPSCNNIGVPLLLYLTSKRIYYADQQQQQQRQQPEIVLIRLALMDVFSAQIN